MPDTFPLLLKEGKLYFPVSHSSQKLSLTAMGRGTENGVIIQFYSSFCSIY
jgi:hypothetical protein